MCHNRLISFERTLEMSEIERLEKIQKLKNKGKELNNLTLVDKAYKQLEMLIITLKLEPGSLWTEKELSEILGLGRMPVREAIQKLAAGHMLKIIPRKGIIVTIVNEEEFYLQLEVRRPLERLLSKRAAMNASDEERQIFLEMADAYEKATIENDGDLAIEIDDAFNALVSECSKNPYAAAAIKPLRTLSRRIYFSKYNVDKKLIKEINYAYCHLMRAIASGDDQLSEKKSDDLLDFVEQLYSRKNN